MLQTTEAGHFYISQFYLSSFLQSGKHVSLPFAFTTTLLGRQGCKIVTLPEVMATWGFEPGSSKSTSSIPTNTPY